MHEQGTPRRTFTPHPYALLLPALTEDEYEALRSDIAAHGILAPVIVDADGLVLDGVHRTKIAAELGIDVPVSQMGQASDEQKMHLVVGLNTRRRHLDWDRRRELVRKLADEQGLTVRKIAAITGWSKSTVDRDLRPPSPSKPIEADGWSWDDSRERADAAQREATEHKRAEFRREGDSAAYAEYLAEAAGHLAVAETWDREYRRFGTWLLAEAEREDMRENEDQLRRIGVLFIRLGSLDPWEEPEYAEVREQLRDALHESGAEG
jgi:ParB-like chromosome segregation protein Spo0J